MTEVAATNDPRSLDDLIDQDARLRFQRFDRGDAWDLGRDLVERALARSLPISACVLLGHQRVFHAGLPGTTADNDVWMARKIRVVRRFDAASLLVASRLRLHGIDSSDPVLGLDPRKYAMSGGAVPLRIGVATIGVVAVSGLTDEADHDLAVEAVMAAHDRLSSDDDVPQPRSDA